MDVIGMTNLQEAKLAREAEMCYVTVTMVTDYDCWHPDHDAVTVNDIIANLTRNAENACNLVTAAVRAMPAQRRVSAPRAVSRLNHGSQDDSGRHAQGWSCWLENTCSAELLRHCPAQRRALELTTCSIARA